MKARTIWSQPKDDIKERETQNSNNCISALSLKYTITTKGFVSSVVLTKEDTGTFGTFYNNIIGEALVGSHSAIWVR